MYTYSYITCIIKNIYTHMCVLMYTYILIKLLIFLSYIHIYILCKYLLNTNSLCTFKYKDRTPLEVTFK